MSSEHNIQLNLNEENEIGFKVKIEGRSNDVVGSKTMIRFTITESDTGRGWIFDTSKPQGQEDGVVVNIPSMKGLVSENKQYNGKLEVILGPHYFTPTEVGIEFIEPLKVEAAITVNKSAAKTLKEETKPQLPENKPLTVESGMIEVKTSKKPVEQKPTTIEKPIKENVKYGDLDQDSKKKVNDTFIKLCESKGIKEPLKILNDNSSKQTTVKIALRKLFQEALESI